MSTPSQQNIVAKQKPSPSLLDLPDEVILRILFWILITDWPVRTHRIKREKALTKLFKPFNQLLSKKTTSTPIRIFDLRLFGTSRRIHALAAELFYSQSHFWFRQSQLPMILQSLNTWQTNNIRRVSLSWQALPTKQVIFEIHDCKFGIVTLRYIWRKSESKPRCPMHCMRDLQNLVLLGFHVGWESAKKGPWIFMPLKDIDKDGTVLSNEIQRQLNIQSWATGWKQMDRLENEIHNWPIETQMVFRPYPDSNLDRRLDTYELR